MSDDDSLLLVILMTLQALIWNLYSKATQELLEFCSSKNLQHQLLPMYRRYSESESIFFFAK